MKELFNISLTALMITLAVFIGSGAQAQTDSASALDKMVTVFQGSHSKEDIQSKMDRAFDLYGVPKMENNYNRYGSVLVRLRKEIGGATEMEVLDYVVRSHSPGNSAKLEEMMALGIVALKSGDR